MAKRKALRAPKYAATTPSGAICFTTAKSIHPLPVQLERGVARARAKHQLDNVTQGPAPQTLADRFHALPVELRAEVFSLLLVQPVKWQLEHDSACPMHGDPTRDLRPKPDCICARCGYVVHWLHWRNWRRHTMRTSGWQGADENPWRSKYAPRPTNDFICADCWDRHFRKSVTGSDFPLLNPEMPCLCARRTNLDVLLVCRQWYEEASHILWSNNTFAFENCALLTAFATGCTAREKITKVSILYPGHAHPPSPLFDYEWPDWTYHKKRKLVIAAMRRFPALTHLELDACFLRDAREVQAMMRLGMRGLRSVRFIYHAKATAQPEAVLNPKQKAHRVYPQLEGSLLLRGGLAEEVARAVKGEHRGWTKHRIAVKPKAKSHKSRKCQQPGVALLKTAVERHVALEERMKISETAPHSVVDCDDEEMWTQLQWKTGGVLHWSQSYLPVGREDYQRSGRADVVSESEVRHWGEEFPFADLDV